ncbi:hypothetical protein MMC30_006054 [Trapelia coarctata]|nr:hypothetical protein [Trapelia coarctata]
MSAGQAEDAWRAGPALTAPLEPQHNGVEVQAPQLPLRLEDALPETSRYNKDADMTLPAALPALLSALDVMQSRFFELWLGTWPDAIEWTAAVMGTQVSASLEAITRSSDYDSLQGASDIASNATIGENLINRYFTHLVAFYFGENYLALRVQAFDDMLWVVLGWLEAIKLVTAHSDLHYTSAKETEHRNPWYATQFIPSFAHRVRIFYELASRGWDSSLCGGGMIWSPYLAPYKNAITNQLYISASVSMYLYFPGDDNPSPFRASERNLLNGYSPPAKANDPKYLEAAVEAYKWLVASNMTNCRGLYVDGYHIHGWRGGSNGSIGSGQCDVRDEKVYTYNQGVILSGLRGLWEATGTKRYLEDGHKLIRNVISATGWHTRDTEHRRRWAGIGRNGILEETCDANGTCNQDGQTFKGIFFHHLTTFCAPLPVGDRDGVFYRADKELASLHRRSCQGYEAWIQHNARAAYRTRDDEGRFGMWWTYGLWRGDSALDLEDLAVPDEGTDYRNTGVPKDEIWRLPDNSTSYPLERTGAQHGSRSFSNDWDPNSRGRGRTVETQSGGVAVIRALYRIGKGS